MKKIKTSTKQIEIRFKRNSPMINTILGLMKPGQTFKVSQEEWDVLKSQKRNFEKIKRKTKDTKIKTEKEVDQNGTTR